jgi:hypothetical protein
MSSKSIVLMVSFGFVHHVVDVCSSVVEEHAASFGWLNQVYVNAEVVWSKGMCQLHGKVRGNLANQSCGRGRRIGPVTSQWEWVPRMALLRVNSGECAGGQMWVVSSWTSLPRAHSWEVCRLAYVSHDLHMVLVVQWDCFVCWSCLLPFFF